VPGRAKRTSRDQRDRQKTHLKMTVVNASFDYRNVILLTHELQQCHAAILYADEVTLVSPRAALMKSAAEIGNYDGVDLLRLMATLAPKYFRHASPELARVMAIIDRIPPRSQRTPQQRRAYRATIQNLVENLRPYRDALQTGAEQLISESGFGDLRLAVDAGILTIDPMPGADASKLENQGDVMVQGLLERIEDVLSTGGRYLLFDADASDIVRRGVEAGYFSPVPMARRLGADAAMADGLFDRLPNFENATTSEILDIRDELAGSLSAFRQGVRGLTEDIDLAPEDPQFGAEIEDVWNLKVSPALDEIDETIRANTSMLDLMRRAVTDPTGLTTMGFTPASALAVAAGPVAEYLTAAGLVLGYSLTAARALIGEHEELRKAKKAQFYFLYGTNAAIGRTDH
jgi:hypothetical protein